jgi:hypothetical protein
VGSQEGRTVDEMGEEGSKGGLTVESFAVFTPPCLALPFLLLFLGRACQIMISVPEHINMII